MMSDSIKELETVLLHAQETLTKAGEALVALSMVNYVGDPSRRTPEKGNEVTLAAMERSYRTWMEVFKTKRNAEVAVRKAERALVSAKRVIKI